MLVSDIELTVPGDKGHINVITKRKPRLSDGQKHPITIIYPDGRREIMERRQNDRSKYPG